MQPLPTSRCIPLMSCGSDPELPIPLGVFLSYLSYRPPDEMFVSQVKVNGTLKAESSLSPPNCMATHRLQDSHHSCEQVYSQRLLLGMEAQQLQTHLSSCQPPWLLGRIWELWLFKFKHSECLTIKLGTLWSGNVLGTQNDLLHRWLWKLVLQPPRHAMFSISLACWL